MNFKKNGLLLSIVIAMIIGIIVGAIINNNSTKAYKTALAEKVQTLKGNERQIAIATHFYEKADKENKAAASEGFSVLSKMFLRLIKMIIAVLVFSVLVVGIAKVGDFKSVGRIGGKTILYFTSATLIALVLGLVIVNIFEPGKVMHLNLPPAGADAGIKATKQTAGGFIAHIIPESIVDAMAKNEILPIVFFSIFFGIGTAAIGQKGEVIVKLLDSVSHVMFKVTNYVMKFAPVGIFGALTAVVIQQGLEVLSGYVYLIACFFGGLLFFVFVVLFAIALIFKVNFRKLLGLIKEPLLLAFSTASSEAAMPKTIDALEKFGISNKVVSFVIPLGYSFNLDGSIMYMTFAVMFIAQSYGIDITFADQIKMMLVLLVTSKGIAGVPRGSFVVIAGTLAMFNIPLEGMLLLLAVDQLLDMGRSATNVIGNAMASAVVAKWEGEKF